MNRTTILVKCVLLAVVFASGICVSPAGAQSPAPAQPAADQAAAPAPIPAPASTSSQVRAGAHYQTTRLSRRAEMYYWGVWGVDSLKVKYTESGEMIRFSWRVLDPERAAALNDKKAEPALIDPQAGVKLVVPQMEKVGKLRQSSTPIAGQSYWMAFSNSGRRVRPGHLVSVEIGQFRAINLVVE